MKRTFLKFTATLLFIFVLFVPAGELVEPQPAQAQFGGLVTDIGDIFQNTISAVTNAKVLTNPIFFALAKATLQAVVKSTVNWINHGFNGSPAFTTNLGATLQSVGDSAANNFLSQLASNGSIKSPFQNQVAASVKNTYLQSTGNGAFFSQNPYTLNKVTTNDTAFLNGQTTQGGLNAWFAVVTNPANSPIGATQLALGELNGEVAGAQKTQTTELNWAKGFLSYRGNCSSSSATPSTSSSGGTSSASSQTPSAASLISAPADITGPISLAPPNMNLVSDIILAQAVTVTPQQPIQLTQPAQVQLTTAPTIAQTSTAGLSSTPTSLSASNNNCFGSSIQTPGTVIEANLEKSLGSGIDSLVSAHDFDEIVNALLGQLMNQVMGSGGLSGLSQPSSTTGGTTYFDQTDPSQATINTALNADFAQTLNEETQQVQQFQSGWTTLNNAAQAAKSALSSSICVPNAQATITNVVQPVITQAAYELTNANQTLATLATMQSSIPSTTDPNATQDLATLSNQYSTLLAASTTPSTSDFTYIQQQSVDTGSSTPPSLYTQMTQLTQQAQQCAVQTTAT